MKYKKNQLIVSLSFIYILTVIIVIINLFNKKIYSYKIITGVVASKDLIKIIVNDEELKLLNDNNSVYIENTKYIKTQYKLEKNILKKDKINYHYIIIKTKLNNKYKENDTLNISVNDKKLSIIEMFKSCWKGT